MPDSMSVEELRRLKQIEVKPNEIPYYPDPPPGYQTESFYPYSFFFGQMGDPVADATAKSMVEAAVRNRKLVPGSTQPVVRLRKHEHLSRKQPYVMYDDVELDPRAPGDDYFPFQSYYYLMDYDAKGPVAVVPGRTILPYSLVRVGGKIYRVKGRRVATERDVPPPPAHMKRPTGLTTFISLEGW
jgi:hypothetical protein